MKTEHGYTLKVFLIRHGKTLLNEKRAYVGRTDDILSENGIAQLKEKTTVIDYPEVDKVFVSPMLRCRQTADIIFPEYDKTPVHDLRETDFGAFEGLTYDELKDDPAYCAWLDTGGEAAPLDGESKKTFTERVLKGFSEVLKDAACLEKIAVVAHGGTAMAIISSYTDLGFYDCMCECGEGFECVVDYELDKDSGNVTVSSFGIVDRIRP